jgi:hypothetical protein
MTNQDFSKSAEDATNRPFAVLCISCGAKMRDDKTEDSFGQCWKCFYRVLNEYLGAQRRNSNPLFASER